MTEESLFHDALAKLPAERAAFLDEACAGQPELRQAVEELLAAHEASGSFLGERSNPLEETVQSTPGAEWDVESAEPPATQQGPAADLQLAATSEYIAHAEAGIVIAGRYTLQEKIGEGGMGEVWVAKQTEPVKRRVALKLIKPGMDSKAVLARFEQERQALAMMDHPNIARVLDGGLTPTGQPFFVMELVNGLPLTKFCDDAMLTPQERLELFVPICQAVQHAHQKGIVHRDLKPSNILITIVDGRPVPKVIDFGVAKATTGTLTDDSLLTQFGAVVGTLEYMSPEQAGFSGVDVDTRADIYSLGVLLYELLTGLRPIDGARLKSAALTEMIRIIQEEEPSKPSTRLSTDASLPSLAAMRKTDPRKLMAFLRGELDWVVMKCLEKQRDRRYETANALVRDIQRYLANEPVEARPPSTAYRMRKFLRRNKGSVTAAGLVLLALVAGISVATWQAVAAENARRDEAAQRSIAVANEKKANAAAIAERAAKRSAEQLALNNAGLAASERDAKNRALSATREKERQLAQAKASLFTTQLTRVAALRDSDPTQALELLYDLKNCPTDLRDAAWRFSERMCNRYEIASINRGADLIAVSPDGNLLATVSEQVDLFQSRIQRRRVSTAHVSLLELPTGKERAALPTIQDTVGAIAFSPDGRRLAIVIGKWTTRRPQPRPGTVEIWDVASRKKTATLTGHADFVLAVAFSPDGKTIATASQDKTAKLWDVETGKERLTLKGHGKAVASVAFRPDGKQVATGGLDNTIRLWPVDGGQPQQIMTGASNPAPEFLSFSKAFGARGGLGATGSFQGKIIDGIISLAYSPDGKTLASGNSNWQIQLWDAEAGRSRLVIRGERRPVHSLAFHPDGRSLFSCNRFETKRWDVASGRMLFTIPQSWSIGLCTDGRLVTAFVRGIRILDVDAPVELATFTQDKAFGSASMAAFSATGDVLAVACGKAIYVWDVPTGKLRATLTGHKQPVKGLLLSPDGRTLASSGNMVRYSRDTDDPARDDIRFWDIVTGKPLGRIEVGEQQIPAIAFSPDGRMLAAIIVREDPESRRKTYDVSLWDVKTRTLRTTLEKDRPKGYSAFGTPCLAFSPDGRFLASGVDRDVALWNIGDRKPAWRISITGGFASAADLSFCRDGSALAILAARPGRAGARGGGIDFRDVKTGELNGTIPGVGGMLVPTPDGKSLVTISAGKVAFCDIASRQVRDTFNTRTQLLALSPNGRILVTAVGTGGAISNIPKEGTLNVKLWDLGPPKSLAIFAGTSLTGRFVPDGKTLAVWPRMPDEPLELWDIAPLRRRVVIGSPKFDNFCKSFSPDGRTLALGGSAGNERERSISRSGAGRLPGQISLWDTQTGKLLKSAEVGQGLILSITFSPDGKTLALVHSKRDPRTRKEAGRVTLWDRDSGRTIASFPRPENHGRVCAFSSDGRFLAMGCEDGSVVVRDLAAGKTGATLKGPGGDVTGLRFNKDGTRLISSHRMASGSQSVVWDWKAGKRVSEPVPENPASRRISRDGRYELKQTSNGLQLIDRTWTSPIVSRRR